MEDFQYAVIMEAQSLFIVPQQQWCPTTAYTVVPALCTTLLGLSHFYCAPLLETMLDAKTLGTMHYGHFSTHGHWIYGIQ